MKLFTRFSIYIIIGILVTTLTAAGLILFVDCSKTTAVLITLAQGFIVATVGMIMLYNIIIKALRKIASEINSRSRDRDLSRIKIKGQRKDELGMVVNGLNDYLSILAEIIINVKSTAARNHALGDDLSDKSDDSINAVKEISTRIKTVSDEITELNSEIEESSKSMEEIYSGIHNLSELLQSQNDSISTSSSAIEEMASSIDSVARITKSRSDSTSKLVDLTNLGDTKVKATESIINNIAKRTVEIHSIISLIDDIAGRTNLLAINASIEAAHAGEMGKGFGVVAGEIRKLAENTEGNVKKISESLKEITDEINKALETSSESSSAFRNITENVSEVTSGLHEISSSMGELAFGKQEILRATTELMTSSQDISSFAEKMKNKADTINSTMSSVTDTSNTTLSNMETVNFAVDELNRIFMQVTTLVQQNLMNTDFLTQGISNFSVEDYETEMESSPEIGITWNDRLSVGNDKIDGQHKWLVENLNAFLQAMITGEGVAKIEDMLDKLGEYVVFHFDDEEKYQESIGYPDLEKHREVHKDFINDLGGLKEALISRGPSPELAIVIQEKVAQWLINHISITDMEYKYFLENQNKGTA